MTKIKPQNSPAFDWEQLEEHIKKNGGFTAVTKKAKVVRQGYYQMKKNNPLPIASPLLQIIEALNLSAGDLRKLFITEKP